MLSLGKFPSNQPQWYQTIFQSSVSKVLLLPTTNKTPITQLTSGISKLVNYGVFAKKPTGFCLYAMKIQEKGGNDLDFDEFDEDDDFLEEELEEEGEGEGEDDEEEFIPLENMKKWVKNKPSGFGEGKEYDTLVEDKLMEEIEQSKRAQLANVNNLKNNPIQPNSKKEGVQQEKISKSCKDAFQVRLVNLPKKRNVHRDLQLAFKGIPGIVDIVPVVSGNKKTRDPICKGLAFINFSSENDAYRFVRNFTGKKGILFGKVQKQIKCEMTTPLLERDYKKFAQETSYGAELAEVGLDSSEDAVSVEHEYQGEVHQSVQAEDSEEDSATQRRAESKRVSDTGTKEELALESSSSAKKKEELQEKNKKIASKRNKKNNPKFNIPGSANRLKIKEKEVLTGVFAKYGANASLATKERS